jgi:hypothetical protein
LTVRQRRRKKGVQQRHLLELTLHSLEAPLHVPDGRLHVREGVPVAENKGKNYGQFLQLGVGTGAVFTSFSSQLANGAPRQMVFPTNFANLEIFKAILS